MQISEHLFYIGQNSKTYPLYNIPLKVCFMHCFFFVYAPYIHAYVMYTFQINQNIYTSQPHNYTHTLTISTHSPNYIFLLTPSFQSQPQKCYIFLHIQLKLLYNLYCLPLLNKILNLKYCNRVWTKTEKSHYPFLFFASPSEYEVKCLVISCIVYKYIIMLSPYVRQ